MFYILLESAFLEENVYLTKMHLGADIYNSHRNYLFLNVNVIAGEFNAKYSY